MTAAPPDIVIADIRLPDGPATDLVGSNGDKSQYPLIVLIEEGREGDGAAAVEAGAMDFLVKSGSIPGDLPRTALRAVREWTYIRERERAEKTILELRARVTQFQRLVTSGLMDRGVARDIENLLTPILGYAETALEMIPPHGHARGYARGEVDHVVKVAKVARDLVRDALERSKNGGEPRKPIDAAAVVEEVLELLRPVAPPGIEIRARRSCTGAAVAANPTQLHRVVMSLCVNAFEAMRSSGGVLQVDIDLAGGPDLPGDDFVSIVVTDTGRGMPPRISSRIFDPFFTTKPAGEGLGLGLPIAREIVNAHGGTIAVESSPGKGSVFQLLLPRFDAGDSAADCAPGRATVIL
jgi:signal transduction histidine kinase